MTQVYLDDLGNVAYVYIYKLTHCILNSVNSQTFDDAAIQCITVHEQIGVEL